MKKRSLSNESSKATQSNISTPFAYGKTRHRSTFRSQFRLFGTAAGRLSERRKLLETSRNVNELSESWVKAKNVIECWRALDTQVQFRIRELEITRSCVIFRGVSWSLRMWSAGT